MSKRSHLPAPLLLLAIALTPNAFAASPSVDPRIEQLLTELGKAQEIGAVAMSPDGKQLAWVIERQGKPSIEVADADGSHARRMASVRRAATLVDGLRITDRETLLRQGGRP